jgi:protease I
MAEKPYDSFVASTMPAGKGESILILTADDTQDLEFFYPYYRFIEEGYSVDVVTPEGGEFKGKQGMGLKETKAIKDVSASLYALLYIPGGKAPAALKKNKDALSLVQNFAASGKIIAAICHGPQILAAAKLIEGRRISAWPEVEQEVKEAGATYVNEPTVIDGQFITARWPGDLPSHMARTLQVLKAQTHRNEPVNTVGKMGWR